MDGDQESAAAPQALLQIRMSLLYRCLSVLPPMAFSKECHLWNTKHFSYGKKRI
jgi:hypothetical protein